MSDDKRKTCTSCRRRRISERYTRKIEGKIVYLCAECWSKEEKARASVDALISVMSEAKP